MKKNIAITLILTLLLSSAIISPNIKKSKALSSTTKLTMISGEKKEITPLIESNPFKSAKSSNKKIVSVKKTANLVTITAKKKGKATITIKPKVGSSIIYIITVKKRNFTWKAFTPNNVKEDKTGKYNSNVMFEISNKTGVYVKEASVKYKVYGTSGKIIASGTATVEDLVPSTQVHFFAATTLSDEKIKSAKVTKITLLKRDDTMLFKYTNRNKSITVSEKEKAVGSITFNLINSLNESVNGVADVVYYKDTSCKKPIGLSSLSLYSNASSSNTISTNTIAGYKAYKVFKRTYTSKYAG